LPSCTTVDRAIGAVPWFTTMRDQAGVRPFEALPGDTSRSHRFLPPEGSVPTTGIEDSLDIYGAGLRVVDAMRNPVVPDDSALARGRRIYNTYCAVCHGVLGRGNGTVAGRMGYVPDLTQEMTVQRSDGYLYALLRHGRGIMPRYGEKIRDPAERWSVVHYVRRLQGRLP
jgi:mono/diheme cytochrome c family protein